MSTSSKTLAYFTAAHDMPEEVIMAANMNPYKILGDVNVSNDPADLYLQNYICPAARSSLTEALSSSKNWAGIGFAHGCDCTNRQYDIWKRHVDSPFFFWFNSPMNMDQHNAASAAKFFVRELKIVIKEIETYFNVKITDEKLKSAIILSNKIKKIMQKLSKLREIKDIPNIDYLNICIKAVQEPKDILVFKLEKILNDWEQRGEFPENKKKVLLTGSDVTYVDWMETMEKARLRVVRDDLSVGERYFATLIPEDEDDPLVALQKYYFGVPRPAFKNPPEPRLKFLQNCMKESKLDGCVSQNLKFCEPYAFDFKYTTEGLKNQGYKVTHIEREFTAGIDHQLVTRLEAFMEML